MSTKTVKKALLDADLMIKDVSRLTGFSQAHLSRVINGHCDSPRAQRSIALVLKKDFEELWPNSESASMTADLVSQS